jgi:hypothetical protein
MSKTATVKVSNRADKELWAACGTCCRETAHRYLTVVDENDESPDGDIQVWNHYSVVQCNGCKTLSFCKQSTCSEDYEYDARGNEILSGSIKLYPSRLAGRPLLEEVYDLPQGVARVYRQTHEALCGKLSVLAGIGVRIIIEAICSDRNAVGGNLFKRIQDLVSKNLITTDGALILQRIRLLGNEAAHEIKANTEDELYAAFEVVEHLLQTVYIIPHKARKLSPPLSNSAAANSVAGS